MMLFVQFAAMLALFAVAAVYAAALIRVMIGRENRADWGIFWHIAVFAACGAGAWFMLGVVTSA